MKFSLKLIGAIMTIALVLCLATSVFAAVDVSQFTDFPTGSWSEPALKAGVENGLINGKGDGRIAPKDYITRAETAAIINRAFGATVKADISKYTDVSSDKWYYADMQKAVNMQTVQGVSDTELRPDGYITREQVFTILARALVITDTNETKLMTFSDGASVSSWARGYTAALVNRGYVNGNAENRLKPQDYITREEFAQVMYNIFKQYIEGYNAKLSDATFGTTVVRTPNLTLKNLVINGDLIIADGVGSGNLTLENVKVSGRILFRGGEGKVKLTKTTVGEFVRIHDVNGVVNFQNYEDEAVFKNHIQDTKATFLKKSSGGGGGGSTKPQKEKYTISFNGKDYIVTEGNKLGSAKASDGTKLSDALEDFVSSQKSQGYDVSYTFDGKAIDSSADVKASASGTIEFTKTPIQYTVTYNLGAADAYFDTTPDGNITVEETLTLPTPKRDGYEFVAWYLDSALTQPVTEIPVGTTSDITVYASWRLATVPAPKYTITYNGVGYEVEEGKALSTNSALTDAMEATVDKAGYTLSFEGTYTKNGSPVTIPVTSSTPAVADMEIKAVYTAIEYTITYYSDGTVCDTDTYTVEDAVTLPIPTKSGFDFDGWYTNDSFTGTAVTEIAVGTTGNKTFYAKWTPKTTPVTEYTITFDGTEYKVEENKPLGSNTALKNAMTAVEDKEGYTLSFKDADTNAPVTLDTVPAGDMEIEVVYTAIDYTITYYSDGAVCDTDTYTVEDAVTLPIPTKSGFDFDGWYTNDSFTGTAVTEIAVGTIGNKTFYAKWTPKTTPVTEYTITFDGTEYKVEENKPLGSNTALKNAMTAVEEKAGYTLSFKDADTDAPVTLDTVPAGDMEIEVVYTAIEYTITYYSDGAVCDTDTYTVEDAVTLPIPTKSGFDFDGWYTTDSFTGTAVTEIAVGTTGNKTFYAKWTPKTTPAIMYTITFDGVDYEVEEGKPLYTNASLKAAMGATEEKAGYTLSFKNADTNTPVTVDTIATSDMTIEAVYTIIKYTITYMYDGAEVLTKGEYTVEDSVTLPTYSKVGYNFGGWYEDEALTSGPVTAIAVGTIGNKVYYAKLTLKPDPELGFSYENDEANNKVTVYAELSAMPKNIDDLAAISIYYTQTPARMTLVSAEALFEGRFAYSDGALVWINEDDSITEDELTANGGKLFKLVYSYTHPTNGDVVLSYTNATELASSTYKVGTGYTKADAVIHFADSYTVTFDGTEYVVEEGEALSSNAALKAAMEAVVEKTGYTLSFENADTSDVVTIDTIVSADMEVKIVYTAIEYTITYYSNGAVYGTDTYTIEESVTLPVLTDPSNSFDGWFADSAFTSGPVTEIPVGTTGNKEFYAKWTPITQYFTVTFDGTTYQVEAGKAISTNAELKSAMEAVTEKTGYTLSFEGTYTLGGVETTEEVTLDTLVGADMVIEAKYTAIKYTITYMYNGTEVLAKGEYTIEDAVTLPDYSMDGYTFHGWYEDEAFTSGPVTEISVGTTGDKIYYAYLTEIPDVPDIFTVSFYEGTNKFKGSYEVEEGTVLTQADVDAKLGAPETYTMQEGYTDSDGNVHEIAPELWYMVDGEWETFVPETTVIDRDIDVHLFTRYAAIYYDTNLEFKGVKIPRIELTIAYDSNTDIIKSHLDTLTAVGNVLEGTIDNIETATGVDLFQTALNKAAKLKIVDENGNIINPEVPVPLHKLLTEDLIMEQIDNYINQNINNEEFIAEILKNDTVVDMILGDDAIREKVLSDKDMRDKLLTTATIKKIIANDDVIEWIITNEEFKKKFIDSDATFDYIVGDLKELLDNSEYHDTIIDACVEFVIDVYFEKTISAPELVNYIDSVLDSPEFIADIEAKPELRSLFKNELKTLLTDLDKNTTSQETRDEVYAEIRGNDTMKNAIIEAVLDNDDIMDDIMAELRDDLAGANSDYRNEVITAVRAEFADSTSTLKSQIIAAVKDDLKLGAGSALRDTVIDAITDDFNSASSQLKDTVMDYATEQITTPGSSLRDSILAEAATPGSDIEGYVKDYASTNDDIKAEIKPLVKDNTEVKAQAQQWISTNIASVKDDIKSAMFTNVEALVIAIKEADSSISDADAQDYANEYVSGTLDTDIKNEIDSNIDSFFADDAKVLSMVEANFDTFYSASYDKLFDELYADPDVFDKAYESYVADASKLEDAFDKYVAVPANLESAVNKFIENADNLADAIEMFVDNASDDAIGDAVDTYIANDDNLIAAVNTYIADDDNLAVVFDLFKEDEDNLKKAFETYIAVDDNLGDAIHTFASDTDVFDNFYEEHLSENAANPDTFNALFESYYHTHVHDVADKAWDNTELHDLIMTYVHDYTEDMVESYADGSLETEHPELVDTIDSLMHERFPEVMREKYYEPGSTIKATIDHLIEEEGTSLIKKYVNDEIDDADTVAFIEDTIEENVGIIVDDYVDGKLDADIKALIDGEIDSYMEKLINDYINNVGDARATLGELVPTYAQDAVDTLKATDAFKNTISDFTSGNGVRVNEENIMFISILSELMAEYDYDKIMTDFAPAKVKTITDKVGKELASKYVNKLLDTFVDGIKEAEANLQADIDNGIEGTEYRFTTTPRLRVYFMDDFVVAPYNKVAPKIAEKLNAIDLIAINPYAQRLVNMNLIEEYLDYDASVASEELSGYSVKKGDYNEIDEVYGSPIVRYYDIELSHKILLHDAIMWYGKDYLGHATVEAKLDAISALLSTFANDTNEAIVEYLQTGELPEDYINKFLGKNSAIDSAYDKAEDVYYQNEDRILQLADKIDEFYMEKLNKDYTEVIDLAGISVYADGKAYPVYEILLELYGEGDAFTIDALATAIFDSDNYLGINAIENGLNKVKKAIVDKFGYKPGTYTNKIVRDAYKAELEAHSIKGISTGSHSVEVQRYFQYIK